MLDASDMLANFADAVLRSANNSGHVSRYSNWVGHDLNGAISLIDEISPRRLIELTIPNQTGRVLDFGCGDGPHKAFLEATGLQWTGLDYAGSIDPTAINRETGFDNAVVKYDGKTFPFHDALFDVVWSYQSLEHVHSAEETFREIARVLKPGGTLLGSTSFLEAYHARSTFCYSPYGFKLLCDRYGLTLQKLYPTLDGLSLVFRHLFMSLGMDPAEYDDWGKMMNDGGAFFRVLRRRADVTGDHQNLAEAMAQVCGQFYFVATVTPGPV